MYKNRVRTPRLYKVAAKVAKQVSEGEGSIKQVLYNAKHPNLQGILALVTNTFQRMELIDSLLKKSNFFTKESHFDPWLAKILMTEMLWGNKRLTAHCPKTKTILAYEQIFKALVSDNPTQMADIEQVEKPRYVRVNTLKISINEMVEEFRNEGWTLKRYLDVNNYSGFLEAVSTLGPEEFMVDIHIPSLLIFPPKTKFFNHHALKTGKILLQDKASCIPVHLLNPEPGTTILDMCAAPGMKTTQAAALIEDKGKIYAVETVPKRYETLNQLIETSGVTCVKTIHGDVFELRENDLPDVEYIIVDPSCSGSGITDRVEIGQQKKDRDPFRLEKLSNMQKMLLRYAFTRHPKAKRVVYSTCSLFPEENEDVVRQVMETCHNFKLVPAGPLLNNVWLNYGSSEFGDIGNYCLYARPDIDFTTGFFVAVFERLQPGEKNCFRNIHLFPSQRVDKKRKMLQDYLDDVNARDTIAFNKENKLRQKKTKKEEGIYQKGKESGPVVEHEIEEMKVKTLKKKKWEKFDNLDGDNDNERNAENKEKKAKTEVPENEDCQNLGRDVEETQSKKKKKKHENKDAEMKNGIQREDAQDSNLDVGETKLKKKKKKHRSVDTENDNQIENEANLNLDVSEMKAKKKKKTKESDIDSVNLMEDELNVYLDETKSNKKKKNKRSNQMD